jgi:hypothetical protein
MKALMKFAYLSSFTLLLSSCGREYDESSFEGIRVGNNLNLEQRILNSFERNIALRICESYRSKWVEFRLNKLNQNFSYQYSANLCDASLKEVNPLETKLVRSSTKEDAPLMFNTSAFINYVQYMPTHIHGDLSLICTPLMTRGETPQISFEQENQTIQFSFKEGVDKDSYTVYFVEQREVEGEEKKSIVTGQDTFEVLTRPENARSSLKGIITSSQRVRTCSDESNEFKAVFTQNYNF